MLTRDEMHALRVLDQLTFKAMCNSRGRYDKPGAFILRQPQEIRDILKNLTSKATMSLRPDAVMI